jgi:hypothetical protein
MTIFTDNEGVPNTVDAMLNQYSEIAACAAAAHVGSDHYMQTQVAPTFAKQADSPQGAQRFHADLVALFRAAVIDMRGSIGKSVSTHHVLTEEDDDAKPGPVTGE